MKDSYALQYPRKVRVGDISVREGLQHEEHFIPLEAKVYYVEESILAGIKRLEITNLASAAVLPQFRDADDLLKRVKASKRLSRAGVNLDEIELTAVTIRERGVDRAVPAKREALRFTRVSMAVSADSPQTFSMVCRFVAPANTITATRMWSALSVLRTCWS